MNKNDVWPLSKEDMHQSFASQQREGTHAMLAMQCNGQLFFLSDHCIRFSSTRSGVCMLVLDLSISIYRLSVRKSAYMFRCMFLLSIDRSFEE